MNLETRISPDHLELIKIFMKANDLGCVIHPKEIEIRSRNHTVLEIEFTDEDSEIKLTYMGLIHAGVLNMFDDYLMKCGVEVSAIPPKSINRQLQHEREERLNEEFSKKYKNVVIAQKVI